MSIYGKQSLSNKCQKAWFTIAAIARRDPQAVPPNPFRVVHSSLHEGKTFNRTYTRKHSQPLQRDMAPAIFLAAPTLRRRRLVSQKISFHTTNHPLPGIASP
jgi:hypothetical protein